MNVEGGWYVDPKNPERDAYWTGHIWSGANRPTEPDTPRFPQESGGWQSAAQPSSPSDSWKFRATMMYVLAALMAIGAVVSGYLVASITGQTCTTNYYDPSSPTCSDTYPYVWAGVGVFAAGALQAIVIYIVGNLCAARAGDSPS